ncbi:sulfotransferase [Roseovarius sp.]|uniref:sulfotransferase n=1 Tax=Roseovarius sp. TaxID=1486281 RepID=UPI003B5AE8B1
MTLRQPSPRPRHPDLAGKTFLVCIGAAKCATSWLHAYLSDLPGCAPSPLKEVHFFDARHPAHCLGDPDALALARLKFHLDQPGDALENLRRRATFRASLDRAQMIQDETAYFGHFARLCGPETRCFADITPGYSAIGAAGFADIRDVAAHQGCHLRVLFIMRDPVARFWSQLRHLEQMAPDTRATRDWDRVRQMPALTARADYAGILTALDATFGAGEVLCLFYETLFTEATQRRLCDFIGVPFAPAEANARHNETTLKAPLPQAARTALAAQLAPQYAFCRDRFGTALPANWQGGRRRNL